MGRELHVRSHPSAVEHWRHVVEIVALMAAAIWAIYVFVYQERIKPASEPPKLRVTVQVEHDLMGGGTKELIKTTVTAKNYGENDLSMGATAVNVYGVRYRTEESNGLWIGKSPGFRFASSSLRVERQKMLTSVLFTNASFGGPQGQEIAPGNDLLYYPYVIVRAGEYDAIVVEWASCYQRRDDRSVTKFKPVFNKDASVDLHALLAVASNSSDVHCEAYFSQHFAV